MNTMLTPRREAVLKIIVREYIEKAAPVASETINRHYRLGVSPATIRNDMAYLEESGYIIRPHISAGAIPLNKSYRYYVESLVKNIELSTPERRLINSSFKEMDKGSDAWPKVVAILLARLSQTMAVVTPPKAPRARYSHLELIGLQDFLVLLVLVLHNARLKRQFLSLRVKVTQEDLAQIANKMNDIYKDLSTIEIRGKKTELSPLGRQITEIVSNLMAQEDRQEYDEPCLEGVPLMLRQPEFGSANRALSLMELMENKDWLREMFPRTLVGGEVKVVIGEESHKEMLQDLSLIVSRYGIPDEVGGVVGVIGPTRMDYRRAISTVRYLSEMLSNLVVESYRSN